MKTFDFIDLEIVYNVSVLSHKEENFTIFEAEFPL